MAEKSEKIGGFDKWEVENAYDTLTRAKEIEKDTKKVAAVKIYAKMREATAKEVSAELKLHKNVDKKLKQVFGKKK